MLEYEIEPRVAPRGKSLYGVTLRGVDEHWHRVAGQNFAMDLGNWRSFEEAEAFVQHLKNNGPAERAREVEYVVVDERFLGYRKPPEKDEKYGTVYVLSEPERGLLNNQKAIQFDVDFVRPATPADFEHYRVHLGSYEKDLTLPLEALTRNYPVMVAGTLYRPTTPRTRTAMEYYMPRDDDMTHGMAPRISAWEIWQYLVAGKLTPQLAASAVQNFDKLDAFDRTALWNFAREAQKDPEFIAFRSTEAAYSHAVGDSEQVAFLRNFGLDDMPPALRHFVRVPGLFDKSAWNNTSMDGKELDKAYYEALFNNEAAFGTHIAPGEDEGRCLLANGQSAVFAASYAEYIQEILGKDRVQIAGFDSERNPDSAYAKWGEQGADFAIVDQRYLIDPWPSLVLGENLPVVYDLKNSQDLARVREIYGDPQTWEPDLTLLSQEKDHRHLAEAHLDAIASHPAMKKFQEAADMGLSSSALKEYSDALLRNHGDLLQHLSGFRTEMKGIAAQGGMNPSDPRMEAIVQRIDGLPANFVKDNLLESTRFAVPQAPALKP